MPNKKKPAKSFFRMTAAERDAHVAKYDRGVPFEETRALSPAERARWERAQAAKTATDVDERQARILISLDPKLLARAHARARRQGKSLSALVSDLLRAAERRAG